MELQNKKILVIGAGISGFAAAKIAKKFGADVTLSDAKVESDLKYNFDELRGLEINLVFGKQTENLLNGVDLVIVSPAVPLRIPILQAALNKKIPVISEVELAYNLAQSPICAVTGTNGKTTTVTLLGLLLESQFANVGVGGNIGVALSNGSDEQFQAAYFSNFKRHARSFKTSRHYGNLSSYERKNFRAGN